MTLRQALAELAEAFADFDDPKLEARHLLMEALSLDLNQLLLNGDVDLEAEEVELIRDWRDRRRLGEPLAYLSGSKAFYKSVFNVAPGVLVPRPETELLVELALSLGPVRGVADFGCGSGCIGLSIIKEIKDARLIAIDQSSMACKLTRENADNLGLGARVEIVHKSVEEWDSTSPLDLIVANPPYIAEGDPRVQKSVHDFEPHEALYASDDGLGAIRAWTPRAVRALKASGHFMTEIGAGQSLAVQAIMQGSGLVDIQAHRDLNQIERVISGKKPG